MPHDRDQHHVFEHVGMVAGMEGVAIAEHRLMLTASAGPEPSATAGGGPGGPGVRSLAYARAHNSTDLGCICLNKM
jgi:hypothetical protein